MKRAAPLMIIQPANFFGGCEGMHPQSADSGLGTDVPANVLQRVVTAVCGPSLQERNRSSPRLQSAECRSLNRGVCVYESSFASRIFAQVLQSSKVAKWQMQCNAAFLEAGFARLTLLHQALSYWWRLGESLAMANCIRKARLENQI